MRPSGALRSPLHPGPPALTTHTRGPATLANNGGMNLWIDLALALPAFAVALWLRPWRGVDSAGPPWPWLAWWAMLPALWGVDRYVNMAVVQPNSLG